MNIHDLESQLNARHLGCYDSGHRGSEILRFQKAPGQLVVKFAPNNLPEAIADLEANIHGYNQLKLIGAKSIVPAGLKELSVSDGKALLMSDLGDSMRKQDTGLDNFNLLWQHFEKIVRQTKTATTKLNSKTPSFVTEVIALIKGFSHPKTSELIKILEKIDWSGNQGDSALMICDFTPDNVFVAKGSLTFIDPWYQKSYLGHPAVSIGQFVTLARIYKMRSHEAAGIMLQKYCLEKLSVILGCDKSFTDNAFKLGVTLQLVLAAYVRQNSDFFAAERYLIDACRVWI